MFFACWQVCKWLHAKNDLTNWENAIFISLDLSSFASIDKFVEEFSQSFDRLDILVNNAGLISDTFKKTDDNIEFTMHTIGKVCLGFGPNGISSYSHRSVFTMTW